MRLFALIFLVDAIVGLASGNNMYTLKPGGANGVLVNVATLLAVLAYATMLVLRSVRWRVHEKTLISDYAAVMAEYQRQAAGWPYEALGLQQSATSKEIRRAHRSLAKRFHPDHNPGNDEAQERFLVVQAAYERLGSP